VPLIGSWRLTGYGNWASRSVVISVLITGFTLVILSLLAVGFFGLQKISSIQRSIEDLEQIQSETTDLIDELVDEQATLNAVFYLMSGNPLSLDRTAILAQLDRTDEQFSRLASQFFGTSEEAQWKALLDSSAAFTGEARRLLALASKDTLLSRELLRQHNQIVEMISQLSQTKRKESLETQHQIRALSQGFTRSTTILLGSYLALSVTFALFTIFVAKDLFRKMEWQTSELSRVSWYLLEKQENAARRFSHELHDELGQSLSALKANVASLSTASPPGPERIDAISDLVQGAIGNVRELSQLLHPTILDDFGLDAGLHWITENFSKHTGLEAVYQSDFNGRLPEQTETHLFRIAQEALTNVAKHSQATRVDVNLNTSNHSVLLSIEDNGQGLPAVSSQVGGNGLGLVGMRARARSMGGELSLIPPSGGGLCVKVRVPIDQEQNR
jgi:signal transduction histidine kinase